MAKKNNEKKKSFSTKLTTFNMIPEAADLVEKNLSSLIIHAEKTGRAIPKKKEVMNAMLKKAGKLTPGEFFK